MHLRTIRWYVVGAVCLGVSALLYYCVQRYVQSSRVNKLVGELEFGHESEADIAALIKLGAPAVEPVISALELRYYRFHSQSGSGGFRVLGEIKDPRAVVPLIGFLKEGDSDCCARQEGAEAALVKIGTASVEPLIVALKGDKDWTVRRSAATVLGDIKDTRAVAPLITALSDSERLVREAARDALGEIKDPRAIGPLIATFKESRLWEFGDGSEALIKIGTPAVEPLIEALENPDPQIREKAAKTLGRIKDVRAVKPLVNALHQAVSVQHRGGTTIIDGSAPAAAAAALVEIGEPAVDPLISALNDGESTIRARAIEVLGKIKDTRAVEPLIAALKDQDQMVRANAARELLYIDDQRGIAAVRSIVTKGDATIIVDDYRSLIQLGIPATEDILIDALHEADSKEMAEVFLNSGNPKLKQAALDWASRHGYGTVSMPGSSTRWGTARR